MTSNEYLSLTRPREVVEQAGELELPLDLTVSDDLRANAALAYHQALVDQLLDRAHGGTRQTPAPREPVSFSNRVPAARSPRSMAASICRDTS